WKVEAGRVELEEVGFSLSDLIESVVGTFRRKASEKGLTLDVNLNVGSSGALIGDPTRVRQILFNLLGNALKFTQRGGVRVHASTSPLGNGRARIQLAVSDTGIGLDAGQIARLFRPFAQTDSATTRQYGGTGLGLSIVRRLAELMDGEVGVESRPGVGSTFTVTLTLRAAPADSPLKTMLRSSPSPRASTPSVRSSGQRVLVVDDHPVNREVWFASSTCSALRPIRSTTGSRPWPRGRPGIMQQCSLTFTCHAWTATSSRARCAKPNPSACPADRARRSLPSPPMS